MEELITISTNNEGNKVVSAKELYDGLGLRKKDWSRWYKTNIVENEYFLQGIEWEAFRMMRNGNETWDFAISIDFAKHIAMMARTEMSHKYRQYFIECEKQLQEMKPQFKLPTTYKEALIELVATIEEKEKIEAEKNKLIHDKKVYTASEIAKELGFKSAQELNKDLKEKKIQYKVNNTWVLCARYSECGYTTTRQIELETGKIIYDTRWTGKGRDWLVNNIYK